MKPSGKLTFSESGHQLENDFLQGVVQPENMVREECEKEVVGERDDKDVKRKLQELRGGIKVTGVTRGCRGRMDQVGGEQRKEMK